jgi:hypothetical protein
MEKRPTDWKQKAKRQTENGKQTNRLNKCHSVRVFLKTSTALVAKRRFQHDIINDRRERAITIQI